MKKRVIIWGIGRIYNQYNNSIRYFELMNKFEVIGLTDRCLPNYSFLDNWRLINKENLCHEEFDWIIVMSDIYFRDILYDAKELGIRQEDVISYKIFNIPDIDLNKYYSLKCSKVSIISNNCWGGIIYSALGLECCSPFKNLFMKPDDYLCLVSNLEKYMKMELDFCYYSVDPHNNLKYPVMRLGNLEVHCNHDNNPNDAREKWSRRKEKMNWNNILLEMYTEDINVAKKFVALEEFEKKLIFVPFEPFDKSMYRLEMLSDQKEFYETVNRNASLTGYMFNLLNLLNGEGALRVKA